MENKIAVVTGATSGIGAAYAGKFAKMGYDLIITGRRKEKIEETAARICEKYNVKAEVVLAEFSEPEGVKKVAEYHEKMGMEKARQTDRGPVKWMAPEEVVDISLKDLEKGKVVSVPGFHTKMLTRLFNLMPRKSYYKFMYQFSQKNFGRKTDQR